MTVATEAATTSTFHGTLAAAADPKAVGKEVGRLFSEHGRMVFALCNVLLRDRPEAEDATQQCFLSAQKSMLAGVTPAEPAAWLAAIARNECLSRLRRRRPETVALREDDHPRDDDIADVVERRAEIAALSEAIAGLPPAQRQAVVLRDFYGLSYREVSVALGVTGPAVESLLFKSRKRLQERLRPFHAASGIAAVPAAVRDALIRAIPGFSSGLPGAGMGAAGLSAKLLSGHAAGKLAALALAAGAGTVALTHEPAKLFQRAPKQASPPVVVRGADLPIVPPLHDLPLVRVTEALVSLPKANVVRHRPVPTSQPAAAAATQTVLTQVSTPAPARVVAAPTRPPTPAPVVAVPEVPVPQGLEPVPQGREPDDPPLPETSAAPVTTQPPTGESHGGGDNGPGGGGTNSDGGTSGSGTSGSGHDDGGGDDGPGPSSGSGGSGSGTDGEAAETTTTTTVTTTTTSSSGDSGKHDGDHGDDHTSTTTTTTNTSEGESTDN